MSFIRLLILILLALALLSASIAGEQDDKCGKIIIPVNVLDKNGIPIKGVTKDGFRATTKGHQLNIFEVSYSDKPRRVTILLDVSGSMKGPERSHYPEEVDKWKIALTAIRDTILSAPPGTQLSLMTFGSRIVEVAPLSVDGETILQWIDRNSNRKSNDLRGKTALYTAILEARNRLEPVQAGDAIYAITDGGENDSELSVARVEHELQASGIRLFIFLLKEARYHSEVEASRLREVSGVVLHSGGYELTITPKTGPLGTNGLSLYRYDEGVVAEIRSATKVVNDQIRSFYSMTIGFSETVTKPKPWRLELAHSQGQGSKEWTLTYPAELPPCSIQ
jgi:hypothetical protein